MFGGDVGSAVRAPWGPDHLCLCVTRHVPNPAYVHRHHIWPLSAGGPEDTTAVVWLCPTSHYDVHGLLGAYDRVAALPPWGTRRRHNPYIRLIAHAGWLSIRKGQVQPLADVAVLLNYAGPLPIQAVA